MTVRVLTDGILADMIRIINRLIMKLKRRSKIAVLIFGIIVLVGLVFFYYQPPYQGAPAGYRTVFFQSFSLSSFKMPVSIRLLAKENSSNDYLLELVPVIGRVKSIKLSGFETDIKLLKIESIGNEDYLFVSGPVGVHSENLDVFKADRQNLSLITFEKDGQSDLSLSSDWPQFNISSRETLDIEAIYRDYDKDPLLDQITENYSLQSNRFVFNK
jgi:hypothetical protein